MSRTMRWAMIALPGAVAVVASLLASRIFLATAPRPWPPDHGVGFALWSLPLGVIVAALALVVRRTWQTFSILWRVAGSLVAGLALGVAYAFAAYFMTGGMVLAFDVPVLYCWAAGAVVGLATGCLIRSEI